MPRPQPDGRQKYGGEIVSGEFVEAGGDAPEVFEFVEKALDEVALAVDLEVDDAPDPDVALAGNVGGCPAGLDQFDDPAGEEAAVGDDVSGQGQSVDQGRERGLVGGLPWRQQEPDRQAMGVDHGVDLGAQSSTRTADGVIRAPFLPPAAC